jgi:hypothetical protein
MEIKLGDKVEVITGIGSISGEVLKIETSKNKVGYIVSTKSLGYIKCGTDKIKLINESK